MKKGFLRCVSLLALVVCLLLTSNILPLTAFAHQASLDENLVERLEKMQDSDKLKVIIFLMSPARQNIEARLEQELPEGFVLNEGNIDLYIDMRREIKRQMDREIQDAFLAACFTDDCEIVFRGTATTTMIVSAPKAVILAMRDCELVDCIGLLEDAKVENCDGELWEVFPSEANPFADVREDSYYYVPVCWAVSRQPQITKGTGADTFSPEAACTRAEAITFLWRSLGCPEPKQTGSVFTDVPAGAYYEKAVRWATEAKIVFGTSETTFSPDRICTRAEIVTILWRSDGMPDAWDENCRFTDIAGTYFTQAAAWAAMGRISMGVTWTSFAPYRSCTRAEIVTFLYRLWHSAA